MANEDYKITINYQEVKKNIQQNLYSNLNLSQFKTTIEDAQKQQVSQEVDNISNEIIIAANDFLYTLQNAQDKIYEAEVIANTLKEIRHKFLAETGQKKWDNKNSSSQINLINSNYNSYNQLKDHMKQLFQDQSIKDLAKKADIFNAKIVKSLQGKELQTIITIDDPEGKPVLFRVKDMGKLIDDRMNFDYSSKGIARLSARFNITSINIAEKLEYLEKIEDENNQDLQKLQNTYQDVLTRYKLARGNYVLWYKNKKWFKAKVSSQGDIIETYNYLYFTQKYKNMFGQDREENVESYMLMQKATVDAVSGLYQGDISEEELIYDYAIKQGNASFLSMVQMASLAENILINAKNKSQIMEVVQAAYAEDLKLHDNETRTEITEGIARKATKALHEYIGH